MIRTEYAELAAERERIARKQTARQRSFVRWAMVIKPTIDHFVWRDPFEAAPAIEEFSE